MRFVTKTDHTKHSVGKSGLRIIDVTFGGGSYVEGTLNKKAHMTAINWAEARKGRRNLN
jgi:hypothetical protein